MLVLVCTGLESILKFNVKYNFGPFFLVEVTEGD